ncbi:MAG: hypothetical protein E5W76_33070 [Mesorhizobium sp.]|nr:MAG: hypothetical protein E5W76_33070 [Mesorhizobium sp.]
MDTTTTLEISAAALKRAQKLRDENDRFRKQAAAELARARALIADIAEVLGARGLQAPLNRAGSHRGRTHSPARSIRRAHDLAVAP